jgi:hypothetical protein
MELKEFVKKVIIDLDQAVSEANAETKRHVRFRGVKEHATALEFDVAVSAESSSSGKGGGGIKVWGISEIGASVSGEVKNSTVSRISFRLEVASDTREEEAHQEEELRRINEAAMRSVQDFT